jgi:catechol 2,3-dioxygenase-like lactoylglutathione lyase family enzyme
MALTRLDHYTILCADLARSRAFYSDVLGMVDGDRPPFDFPGAWLYVGDRPVVHLVAGRNDKGVHETGSVDHVAFTGENASEMRERLTKRGVAFEERTVPGRPLRQIFLYDPDGVQIEINYFNG